VRPVTQFKRLASFPLFPVENAMSTPLSPRMAPVRAARLEEKADLQELNHRLEFLILRLREREAGADGLSRQLADYKQKVDQDKAYIQKTYSEKLDEARAAQARYMAEIDALRTENASKDNQIQHLSKELEGEKKLRHGLDERGKELSSELAATKTALFEAEEKLHDAEHQLNTVRDELANTKEELARMQELAHQATEIKVQSEVAAESAKQDLETYRTHTTEEVKRYREQISELAHATSLSADEIRAELTKQLEELLAEKQLEFQEEKEAGMAELKNMYDEKIFAYRSELESIGHELETERASKNKLLADFESAAREAQEAIAIRRTLAERIIALEEQLNLYGGTSLQTMKEEIKKKNEIIRRMKVQFARKDAEFDELMDVKIALAMEIQAYRNLLEDEEDRLGYKSPVKKRRRDAGMGADMPEFEEESTDRTSSLMISGMDLEGQYITIRNGSTMIVPLNGWTLRTAKKNHVYRFPDVRMRPGESFTVRTLENGETTEGKQANAWIDANVMDETGDEVMLVNPKGDIKATVEVIPTNPNVPITPGPKSYISESISKSSTTTTSTTVDGVTTSTTSESSENSEESSTTESQKKDCIIM